MVARALQIARQQGGAFLELALRALSQSSAPCIVSCSVMLRVDIVDVLVMVAMLALDEWPWGDRGCGDREAGKGVRSYNGLPLLLIWWF